MSILAAMVVFDAPIALLGHSEGITLYVNTTGSGGAYTSIQDAINTTTNRDTVFVYAGTYFENLVVNKSINIIGEDKVKTIIDGGNNDIVLKITEDWVNISFLTLTNAGPFLNQYTLEVQSNHNTISNITTSQTRGYGIYLENSHWNNIINNNISSNGWHGIYLYNSDWNNISKNTVSSNSFHGIHLSQSNWCNLTGNNVSENDKGIYLYYSTNNSISFNNVISNINQGIYLINSDENEIIKNTVSLNYRHGVHLTYSDYNYISANQVSSNNWSGVSLFSTYFNKISDNSVTSNTGDGIAVYESFVINITRNLANSNVQDGINVYTSSEINVTSNTASNNKYGISLSHTNESKVIENTIFDNNYGINLLYSQNISIYHNMIVNNIQQSHDDSENNSWDDGYPSGGNYWSDYTGDDSFKGPNQDIPGQDGIGDTPYTDPFNEKSAQDNYPLIEPHPDTLPPAIKLISPDNNSIIESGVILEFDIYDTNLDFVNFSIDEGDYHPLYEPYHILTGGWVDGHYTINIRAFDQEGNSNISSYSFTINTTPPFVASTTPINNSMDVNVSIGITIIFSESMNKSNIEDHLSLTPSHSFKIGWDSTGSILYISFETVNLVNGTTYSLTIDKNITDSHGNSMTSDLILIFTTKFTPLLDTDNDGIPDIDDPDDDNDGIPDDRDDFPLDPERWEKESKQDLTLYILLLVIVVIITMILVMLVLKQKKGKSEPIMEEPPEVEHNELPPPPPPPQPKEMRRSPVEGWGYT